MAKPGLPKKKKGGPSPHSRAARRATSPSLAVVDKSLNGITPPKSSPAQPSVLAIHQGAGVTKRSRKGRKAVMSSRARRRHEREVDRAEAIVERTAKKVAKSNTQLKAIRSRRKPWDEVNGSIPGKDGDGKKIAGESAFAALGEHWETEDEMDGGEEAEDAEMSAKEITTTQAQVVPDIVPDIVPMPEDDDEIL